MNALQSTAMTRRSSHQTVPSASSEPATSVLAIGIVCKTQVLDRQQQRGQTGVSMQGGSHHRFSMERSIMFYCNRR